MSTGVSSDFPILWKGDEGYEAARARIFPLTPPRYPEAVVRPTKVEHVVEAVKLAKSLGLKVALRSGGHSWAAWSLRKNSILIDFVDFKHTKYNPKTEIYEASPSTTSMQSCQFLESHGRFVPAGHCGDVGLGGFLLQGGMGLNARGYGWLCYYLVGIEVVTAEGEILYCDENQNSDLFWAARGSGPGFPAIVTSFHLKTRPALPVHQRSTLVYSITEYDAVMKWLVKILPSLHRDVEPLINAVNGPEQGYILIVSATVRSETLEDANNKLAILTDGHPAGALSVEAQVSTTYKREYDVVDALLPKANQWRVDNVYLDPSHDFVEVCRPSWTSLPPGGNAYWEPMDPVSTEPLQDMAFSMHTNYYVALYTASNDLEVDASNQEWMAKNMATLLPYAVGSYLGDSDFRVRVSKFWSDSHGTKLMEVRKKYNPEGHICGYLDQDDKSGVDGLVNELSVTINRVNTSIN